MSPAVAAVVKSIYCDDTEDIETSSQVAGISFFCIPFAYSAAICTLIAYHSMFYSCPNLINVDFMCIDSIYAWSSHYSFKCFPLSASLTVC